MRTHAVKRWTKRSRPVHMFVVAAETYKGRHPPTRLNRRHDARHYRPFVWRACPVNEPRLSLSGRGTFS